MAQRKPVPIQSAVEVVTSDEVALARNAFAPARVRPHIPARTEVQFERQLIRQQFQKERTANAIRLAAELNDEATAEVMASLAYAQHLERGFGDELTETEQAFFATMKRQLINGTIAMTSEAIAALTAMAVNGELPEEAVTDWDAFCRWLATH
jgi:hypothetical protein